MVTERRASLLAEAKLSCQQRSRAWVQVLEQPPEEVFFDEGVEYHGPKIKKA